MFSTTEQLESAALGLPASERARLAERLIASLDEDSEIEHAWIEEIRQRLKEYETGNTAHAPASEVFARARDRLR